MNNVPPNNLDNNPHPPTAPQSTLPMTPNDPPSHSCKCLKSKCLKLYCECFRHNSPCSPSCECLSCHNTQSENGPTGSRTLALLGILRSRPTAFEGGSEINPQNNHESVCAAYLEGKRGEAQRGDDTARTRRGRPRNNIRAGVAPSPQRRIKKKWVLPELDPLPVSTFTVDQLLEEFPPLPDPPPYTLDEHPALEMDPTRDYSTLVSSFRGPLFKDPSPPLSIAYAHRERAAGERALLHSKKQSLFHRLAQIKREFEQTKAELRELNGCLRGNSQKVGGWTHKVFELELVEGGCGWNEKLGRLREYVEWTGVLPSHGGKRTVGEGEMEHYVEEMDGGAVVSEEGEADRVGDGDVPSLEEGDELNDLKLEEMDPPSNEELIVSELEHPVGEVGDSIHEESLTIEPALIAQVEVFDDSKQAVVGPSFKEESASACAGDAMVEPSLEEAGDSNHVEPAAGEPFSKEESAIAHSGLDSSVLEVDCLNLNHVESAAVEPSSEKELFNSPIEPVEESADQPDEERTQPITNELTMEETKVESDEVAENPTEQQTKQPQPHFTDDEVKSLATFISSMKLKVKKNKSLAKLWPHRIRALEDCGVRVFENENDARFDAMFDKLLAYRKEMGTFRMPSLDLCRESGDEELIALHNWVFSQVGSFRYQLKAKKVRDVKKFLDVGFSFEKWYGSNGHVFERDIPKFDEMARKYVENGGVVPPEYDEMIRGEGAYAGRKRKSLHGPKVKRRPKVPKVDDAEEVEVDRGWELVDASDAGEEFKVDGGERLEEQGVDCKQEGKGDENDEVTAAIAVDDVGIKLESMVVDTSQNQTEETMNDADPMDVAAV